jgi:hypothetical protein
LLLQRSEPKAFGGYIPYNLTFGLCCASILASGHILASFTFKKEEVMLTPYAGLIILISLHGLFLFVWLVSGKDESGKGFLEVLLSLLSWIIFGMIYFNDDIWRFAVLYFLASLLFIGSFVRRIINQKDKPETFSEKIGSDKDLKSEPIVLEITAVAVDAPKVPTKNGTCPKCGGPLDLERKNCAFCRVPIIA